MKINVIKGKELTDELITNWLGIQKNNQNLANPFFCPHFTSAVSFVRDDIYVGIIEEDNNICGFFPFQYDKNKRGMPVGKGISDYQGLIIPNDRVSWNAKELLKKCGLQSWEFDHLIMTQHLFHPYHNVKTVSPIIDLKNGFEDYKNEKFKQGNKQVIKAYKRLRQLNREVGKVHFEASVDDKTILYKLMRWKSAQHVRTSVFDHFSQKWMVELFEYLHNIKTPDFSGLLSVLFVNKKPIAIHMGICSRTVWHFWFSSFDRAYSKYSPGIILRLKMAESAESLGISMLDMGKVIYPYKRRFMNNSIPIAEGVVTL
jgi:CelD/BcsL family acetyltransferase involved in cellulose biosynthesis